MDAALWSLLPEEIVERVFERLPFSSIIQLRTLCKKWNAFILSPRFSPVHPQNPKCVPVYYHKTERCLTFYDSKQNYWDQEPLPFLRSDFSLIASAGGLLCFSNYSGSFVVCNPATKRWEALQAPETVNYHQMHHELVVGLVVDQYAPAGFKVVLADLLSSKTYCYNSSLCAWRQGADLPDLPAEAQNIQVEGRSVSCNGNLFFLISGLVFEDSEGDADAEWLALLLKYDVAGDNWTSISVPAHCTENSRLGAHLSLLERRGNVLLVSGEYRSIVWPEPGPEGLYLAGLQIEKLQYWGPKSGYTFSINYAQQLLTAAKVAGDMDDGTERVWWGIVGAGDLIFAVGTKPGGEETHDWRVVAYDFSRCYVFSNKPCTFTWLPEFGTFRPKFQSWEDFRDGFAAVEPSLRAPSTSSNWHNDICSKITGSAPLS